MLLSRVRLVACLLGSVATAAATAQTTLKLSYPGSTDPCVFTSDSQGVRLDPATGELLANGSFGGGCPTGAVASPSFTNSLVSGDDTSGTIILGAGVTLKWAADADSCSYTGSAFPETVAGWPTSGAACSNAADCGTLHTFPYTPGTAGNYTFSLQCLKTGNPTPVASQTTITVNPPGGGGGETACSDASTLPRQTTGKTWWISSGQSINSNDLTQFKTVWGRDPASPNDTGSILDWPNRSGVLTQQNIVKNNYVALKFTVPSGMSSTAWGTLQGSTTMMGGSTLALFSMTITKDCYGALSTGSSNLPSTGVGNICYFSNKTETGTLYWSTGTHTGCKLTPGDTYYLNIVTAPLTTTGTGTSACSASTCGVSISNTINSP